MKNYETDKKYKNDMYILSTDYNLLWTLIQDGENIPAWVFNRENKWRIVEVCNPNMHVNEYSIGSGFVSYNGEISFDGFELSCICFSLHFIVPKDLITY